MNEAEKWQKRFERERASRKEAESLLEQKSLELYQKAQALDKLVGQQSELIEERAKELAHVSAEADLLSDAVSRTENGVIITGPDDTVIWANTAIKAITGYEESELLGKNPGKILQGKDSNPDVRDYMRRQIQSREPFQAEILNYRKSGSPYWIRLQATPVFDDSNTFKYFVAIQTDITKERETMQQLEHELNRADQMAKRAEEANTAKSKFLATMSHELRTPLNGIIGYAQILERSSSLDERSTNQARIMRRSGEHLLSLINDLLDLSKIEAGSHTLTHANFDLDGMLKSVIEILSSKAIEKGLKLELMIDCGNHIPDDTQLRIYSDSRAIRQVIINLLGNAIKYTDSGLIQLKVSLKHFERGNAVIDFAVIDTGRGIPSEKIATLFDPFTQVDAERDIIQGTGLGLYIAHNIVRELGDELLVESTPQKGSCFSFKLRCPMTVTTRQESTDSDQELDSPKRFPVSYRGQKRKILVVDDIEDNRAFLSDLLAPMNFSIDLAKNGREALAKIKRSQYDLVLSDVIMPFMNGYDLIKAIRRDPEITNTRVVAVSASLMKLSKLEQEDMENFNGFISKPIQADELIEALRQQLDLEWIYEEEKYRESRAPFTPSTGSSQTGEDPMIRLCDYARIGDLAALKENYQFLEDADPALCEAVEGLLKRYQLRAIADLLSTKMREHRSE